MPCDGYITASCNAVSGKYVRIQIKDDNNNLASQTSIATASSLGTVCLFAKKGQHIGILSNGEGSWGIIG